MTVGDLQTRMTNAEFVGWQMFHARKAQRREMAELKAKNRKR